MASLKTFDTEYDRAKVPPCNGNDPPPAPGSQKAPVLPPLLNEDEVQNKGTQGLRARYGAELPPIISIVRYPGRPVMFGMETWSEVVAPSGLPLKHSIQFFEDHPHPNKNGSYATWHKSGGFVCHVLGARMPYFL